MLSILAAKLGDKNFNRWRFVLEFFTVQLIIFSLLNLAVASFYTVFEELQPFFLLLAAVITFALAVSMYLGKPLPVPLTGSIYGIALSPCSIGFAVAASVTSTTFLTAVLNALAFALGVVTPIAVVLFVLESAEPIIRRSFLIERMGVVLLFVVSLYLAYLAGSTWRWLP